MNTRKTLLLATAAMTISSTLRAETIPFAAGDFENSPSSSWSSSTSGIASTSFPDSGSNTVGRISPTLGNGSLRATVPANFQPNSLYEITFDFTASDLVAVGTDYAIEIRDGADNVVTSLSNAQLVGLLGLNLAPVNNLTLDLNLLDSAFTEKEIFLGSLRDLLGSLTINGAVLPEIHELINQLEIEGADGGLLNAVVQLLDDVTDGSIQPGDINDQLIADLLGLNLLHPVVIAVSDLLDSLGGNEDPIDAVKALLAALLTTPEDLVLVDGMLTTLLGESELLGEVTNLLNLALVEELLGGLTTGDTLGLLGILDPGQSGVQTARLLFTTGTTPPAGSMDIVLNASATLALTNFDYDNIGIRRFDLVSTPRILITNSSVRPVVSPDRQRVIRRTTKPSVTIRGMAAAFGQNNAIDKVEVAVRGSGVTRGAKSYKAVRGKERWVARVRVPVSPRTRLLFRAVDTSGNKSPNALVRVNRS